MATKNDADAIERKNVLKRLYIATILCGCFLVVEVVGGLICGSLAVLSDAAHLFSDMASFAVAIAASYLASLPATANHTYGLKRTESLAALFSMTSLAFVSVGLVYTAVARLINPPEGVDGKVMSIIAGIGVVVNVALAFVLGEHHVHLPGDHHGHNCDGHDHSHSKEKDHHDHGHHANETSPLVVVDGSHDDADEFEKEKQRNVNLHAAYLHVLGDLAQSVAVLIGGIVIWWRPDYHIVDPILTLGFSMLVLYSTVGVLKSSVAVLLEETPSSIDWKKVYDAISALPGVDDVHDLHIWCISHGQVALSVHCTSSNHNAISNINLTCKKFGIDHSTIQVNQGACMSCSGPDCCVSHLCDRSEAQ
ncbi:cation diffusion facilitator [Fragilariopsis cylindrus CCMP1102]|uniref:Cation diffusion facilitator n=1 Tax=Fragilariopsis cylindrus CCMP1102 TaxID=635003 RepID=A0A1E7FF26_9STRA|nr:cation diffusion facilitator [Fragilariopsis cylindrus CCMP1102]|eukprot:OEU16726.1 cation diffusion facilitator [Fragilariopsis cylindrus CCMP1102]